MADRDRDGRYDRERERGRDRDRGAPPPRRRRSKFDVTPDNFAPGSGAEYIAKNPAAMVAYGSKLAAAPQIGRQARRLYCGNVPLGTPSPVLEAFITDEFARLVGVPGFAPGQSPLVSATVTDGKQFAFLEFRGMEDATKCLELDGVVFNGNPLRIKRTQDYQNNSAALMPGPMMAPPGGGPGGGMPPLMPGGPGMPMAAPGTHMPLMPPAPEIKANPNRLKISNLPTFLNEDQVRELLASFGAIKSLELLRDANRESRGIAYFEYANPDDTDKGQRGLNKLEMGSNVLTCVRDDPVAKLDPSGLCAKFLSMQWPVSGMLVPPGAPGGPPMPQPTHVLELLNLVALEELEDDIKHANFVNEVKEFFLVIGSVVRVEAPRPPHPHALRVFVDFEHTEDADKASRRIEGKYFNFRMILHAFITRDDLDALLAEEPSEEELQRFRMRKAQEAAGTRPLPRHEAPLALTQ